MKTKIKKLLNIKFYILTTAFLVGLGGIAYSYNTLADEVVVVEPITYQRIEDLTIEEWVYRRVEQHLGSDEALNAIRIITCESNWNPDAIGVNTNGTADLGLWQINEHYHKDISNQQKLDYQISTDWAINKRIRDGNWNAWTCSRVL